MDTDNSKQSEPRELKRDDISHEIRARFWSKVNILSPDDCWEWQAAIRKDGYGSFCITRNKRVITYRANRFAYAMKHGSIAKGINALHHCDNPACVNPDHLFLGTQADNMADKAAKGKARGVNHPGAKLTEQDVHEIRRLIRSGERNISIANRYGVCDATIRHIVSGKNWSHI